MPPKSTSSFSPKKIWKKKYPLNKKIPNGFGIFSKRLVRTSALPSGRFRSPSKMLGFSRGNTMPRRNAPRQLLTILLKVQFGGEGGIRTHERISPLRLFENRAFNHSATSPFKIKNYHFINQIKSPLNIESRRLCAVGGVLVKEFMSVRAMK